MRRRLTARHLVAAGATLAVTAAILPPATAAIDDPVGTPTAPVTTDSRDRDSVLAPTQAQLDAVRALVAAAPKGARATWDERFGTPRSLVGTGGYLTGARSGSAADVARGWVAEHKAAFGMTDAQVADLVVSRDHALPGTGTHVVTLTQVFGGIEAVHGGRLNVAVDRGRQGPLVRRQPDPRHGRCRAPSRSAPPTPWTRSRLARARQGPHAERHRRAGRLHDVRQGAVRGRVLREEGRVPDRRTALAPRSACCSSRRWTRPTTSSSTRSRARSSSATAWSTTSPRAPSTRTSRATPARAAARS